MSAQKKDPKTTAEDQTPRAETSLETDKPSAATRAPDPVVITDGDTVPADVAAPAKTHDGHNNETAARAGDDAHTVTVVDVSAPGPDHVEMAVRGGLTEQEHGALKRIGMEAGTLDADRIGDRIPEALNVEPATQDNMVAALLRERASYADREDREDRLAQVDEQLRLRGYNPDGTRVEGKPRGESSPRPETR